MSNYLLAYKGGGMPETDEERQQVMAAWSRWFEALGSSLIDAGNPFGPSRSIASDGGVSDGGGSALTGYSIISAQDIETATERAKGSPILISGGSVEVYEGFPVM